LDAVVTVNWTNLKKLYARSMRPALATALTDTPVVALLGPRQRGKSTLVKTFTPEFTYICLNDTRC
jgi:predicted AAA+ superfamily ATPase